MEQKSRLASKFEFDLTAACLSLHLNKVSDSDDARSPTVEIVVWLPSGCMPQKLQYYPWH